MPVLHRQHLKYCHKCHCKSLIIGTWELFVRAKIIAALENLATKKSVDKYEDEHEEYDHNEIHDCALHYAYHHFHGFEGSKDTCYTENTESTKDAHRSEGL